jgi:hypothetical protein
VLLYDVPWHYIIARSPTLQSKFMRLEFCYEFERGLYKPLDAQTSQYFSTAKI